MVVKWFLFSFLIEIKIWEEGTWARVISFVFIFLSSDNLLIIDRPTLYAGKLWLWFPSITYSLRVPPWISFPLRRNGQSHLFVPLLRLAPDVDSLSLFSYIMQRSFTSKINIGLTWSITLASFRIKNDNANIIVFSERPHKCF